MTEPCGCPDRTDHVDPATDPVLGLAHGERSEMNGDPLPHDVPGTGDFNGLYSPSPDAYCLCGHPNYLTCDRWGDLLGMTIQRGPAWTEYPS